MFEQHESLIGFLRRIFAEALARLAERPATGIDPLVRPAGDPRFGDYQCNAALGLAKELRTKPRDLAARIVDLVQPALAEVAEPLEIAGPGFINIRLTDTFLARRLAAIPAPPADAAERDRVGLPPVTRPQRVVVEYSQPNIAKQMHVGHLRSTIIGDVFARVLAFLGHEVIRQNHIGDWGTQFGMLIRYYREHPLPNPETHPDVLAAIEDDYRAAQERFDADELFAREARLAVARLQAGDPEARRIWQQICSESLRSIDEIYRRLGVLLRPEDVRGESFYNDRLAPLIEELRAKLPPRPPGYAPGRPWAEVRDDQGAVCVFLYDAEGRPRFKTPEGEPLPVIIRKSDGGFLYATTDLAAIRFRLQELGAQRVIYVTDARQKLHFEMFLEVARAAGWIADDVSVEHVTFGTVLGADRKPLKTREGRNIRLSELLDEAEKRAAAVLEAREQVESEDETVAPLTPEEKREIARRVGVAAVKYADLRNDRRSDYVFSWDKLLALQGNTAPYLMYAYARIRSIYRKAAERFGSPDVYAPGVVLTLGHPTERALALRLARLPETIETLARELEPHTLCTYLYELASDFMRFYEACPVLQAQEQAVRLGRMRLCDLTARALRLGLNLLGIEPLERM